MSSERSRKGQPDRHHVEAEIEILAEQALIDQDAQVLVGRGDDAHASDQLLTVV